MSPSDMATDKGDGIRVGVDGKADGEKSMLSDLVGEGVAGEPVAAEKLLV